MKLFDLHCDTATRLLSENESLYNNSLHVSLKKAAYLEKYAQVMAIWTHHKLSDSEGYERFLSVADNLFNEIKKNEEKVELVTSVTALDKAVNMGKTPFILAVEDARILESDITRLDVLYRLGVRLMTLNWSGVSCIGGAHNTNAGLSDFGIEVLNKCFDIGIIPDISHSSFEGAEQALEIAKSRKRPVIASHSDAFSINPHTRNLRDKDFISIRDLGGIVGINLCPAHLSSDSSADVNDIIRHIEHYLSLGGEEAVSIGGDLDGTDLPSGFSDISDIQIIAEELSRLNYSNELIDKIIFENAFNFFKNHL